MKKLKSLLIKIKSKVTVKSYQKPLVFTILTLLLLNAIVVLIGSIIAYNINPDIFNNEWRNALGSAFKWMISANSINNVEGGYKITIVAAIVIAIEMILFSGAMVATLTTAMRSYIDKMSKAKGKIDIEDHYCILGWNSKVPEMVNNLLLKGYKNSIVILSMENKDNIISQINSVKSISKHKLNLIIKEGNPLIHSTLEDISIEKASNIVVMNNENYQNNNNELISINDLEALKIVLALGNFKLKEETKIVVEMENEESIDKITNLSKTLNNLKDKYIIPVSFTKKIGQIISQTIVWPEIANIYYDLLSYEGSEFYSYNSEEVEDFLNTHNNAIPIIKYDKLWVLAEDETDIPLKRRDTIKRVNIKVKKDDIKENSTIFVIGDNKKHRYVVDNLNNAASYSGSNITIKDYKNDEIDILIEDIKNTEGLKKVLILSDDTVKVSSYDANVFVTLIALQTAFPNRENLSFITELLDSRNRNSVIDFNINNAIISNKIISLLLTQLSLNQDSKRFFDNLFIADTENGGEVFDININKASDVIDIEDNITFNSKAEFIHSFYYSFNKDAMPIALIHNNKIDYLCKNQDKKENIIINKEDKIVYINY